jgi:hypothetical protein
MDLSLVTTIDDLACMVASESREERRPSFAHRADLQIALASSAVKGDCTLGPISKAVGLGGEEEKAAKKGDDGIPRGLVTCHDY